MAEKTIEEIYRELEDLKSLDQEAGRALRAKENEYRKAIQKVGGRPLSMREAAPPPPPAKPVKPPRRRSWSELGHWTLALFSFAIAAYALVLQTLQPFQPMAVPSWVFVLALFLAASFMTFIALVFLAAFGALAVSLWPRQSEQMQQMVEMPAGGQWTQPWEHPIHNRPLSAGVPEFDAIPRSKGSLDDDGDTQAYLQAIGAGKIGPQDQFSDFLARRSGEDDDINPGLV